MRGLLKAKPATNQFLVLFGITLLCLVIGGLIGNMIMMSVTGIGLSEIEDVTKTNFNNPAVLTFFRGMQVVQFLMLMVIPSFICAWLFSTNSRQYLGLKKPSNYTYFAAAIAIMILAIPLAGWLGQINKNIPLPASIENWMKEQEASATYIQNGLLSRRTTTDLLLNIVLIAATAGVGEELLFRGMAQRLLIKMFKSPWAGIIISAILFSAMHMQFYGFLPRLLLGILLGATYWYSGSLWVSILAHFVYDAFLLVLIHNKPALLNESSPVGDGDLWLAGLVSAVIVLVVVYWMKKKSTTRYEEIYKPVKNHPFDFEQNIPGK